MTYRVETGSRRFVGSGGVIVVHATLAYLLVFGLAAPDIIRNPPTKLVSYFTPEPVETPPPEEREEPKPDAKVETPVHNPDPKIDLPTRELVKYEPPIFTPLPPTVIAQPPLAQDDRLAIGLLTPKLARPINNVLRWVTTDDYPRVSIIREEQGVTGFSLKIDARGKVSECAISRSSGSKALDDATCRKVRDRAKFEPAVNQYGERVPGTYSNSVNWKLPE